MAQEGGVRKAHNVGKRDRLIALRMLYNWLVFQRLPVAMFDFRYCRVPGITDILNANEPGLITNLLQSFITCILEAYVNSNGVEWASRMLEYTYPERIVPGRKTMIQTFKEVVELQAKDALVGQLVVGISND